MDIAPHLEKLKEIAGPGGWITNEADKQVYLEEPRGKFHGKTPLVLLPDSTETVARIITCCARHKIAVVPQGGNTGLVGGNVPDPSGQQLILNLKRMKQLRARDADNLAITVEAGCILADIQDEARAMGCLFPLSLAAEGSCMIGGNIATNAGGVNVLRYGNMRALVLGLEVVLPSGEIWHGLGGLRKDNTGYDLKQYFIGSEGTLGIITAATLALHPFPHEKQTAFVAVTGPEAAVELLSLARNISGGCLTAFEIIPRAGIDFVTRHMPATRAPMDNIHDWYILLECSTSTSRDLLNLEQVMARILAEAMHRGLVTDGVIAKNEGESRNLWQLRENLSEAQKHEGGSIKHDISLPISTIPDFLRQAEGVVEMTIPGARIIAFGHLGDGNLHYNISQPEDMNITEFLDKWPLLNGKIHDIIHGYGGSFSAEHGIGRLKTGEMEKYKSQVELTLMRRIKNMLDPDNIMNPGVILSLEKDI